MNPFKMATSCVRCHDTRTVTKNTRAATDDTSPCPSCGSYDKDEYGRFRSATWSRANGPPTICEVDLTEDEFEWFKLARSQDPQPAKLTVLTWIEGRRYDPSKDEEFLAVAREKFKEWRDRA